MQVKIRAHYGRKDLIKSDGPLHVHSVDIEMEGEDVLLSPAMGEITLVLERMMAITDRLEATETITLGEVNDTG